jgi:hypothetical protein
MNYDGHNSTYVEPYAYTTHAIQLQPCKNNIMQLQMQPICNYYCNIMLTLFFIHPSMMNFVDFHCRSNGNTLIWLQPINNHVAIHINYNYISEIKQCFINYNATIRFNVIAQEL